MNLNFGAKPDYQLNSGMIKEVINMYGIQVRLILQERVNNDQVVFGDRTHLFSDNENSYEMFMLPENQESLDNLDIQYSQFGMQDMQTCNLFVHRDSFYDLSGVEPINSGSRNYSRKMKPTVQSQDMHLVGSLVVLPSGKILEITDQTFNVQGINNIYSSKNDKSVYQLTCVQYQHKLYDELDEMDTSTIGSDFEEVNSMVPDKTLEDYFHELSQQKDDQDFEAEINDTSSMLVPDKEGQVQQKRIETSVVQDIERQPWE